MSPTGSRAIIIASYGRRFDLRFDDGHEKRGRIKGRRLQPVCGDRVVVEPLPNEAEWVVTSILPRANALTRPDRGGRVEVLAANLDLIAVVAAPLPAPDWFIVDRYLCAAAINRAASAVIFNKTDLEVPAAAREALAEYARVGYPVLRLSARKDSDLGPLRALLAGRTAVIVGQSGVGKSSLINALSEDDVLPTAPVSEKRSEGRHTTVATRMRKLESGGDVIDSPGVRDYAPAVDVPAEVARGFPEIDEAGRCCRFADCAHMREPDCNVRKAVDSGIVSPRRYESYRRLWQMATKRRKLLQVKS